MIYRTEVYQKSLESREWFLRTLVPLTLSDIQFSGAIERAKHVRYWQEEDRKLDEALDQLDRLSISDADRAEQLAIKDFVHQFPTFFRGWSTRSCRRGPIYAPKALMLRSS